MSEQLLRMGRETERRRAQLLGFDDTQLSELRSAFHHVDKWGTGVLGREGAKTIAGAMGMTGVKDEVLERYFHEVDEEMSGNLEFPAFMELIGKLKAHSSRDQEGASSPGRRSVAPAEVVRTASSKIRNVGDSPRRRSTHGG